MATVYKASRVFDGKSEGAIEDGAVVVEGERITFVGPSTDAPPGAEEGKYLVPTMSVYAAMSEKSPELGAPDYIQRKTADVLEASHEAFQLALDVGVKIAAGTDCGAPGHQHGTLPEELKLMVEAGATPVQAIRFGTAAAAELLGIDDELGTLEPGKRADLLAVADDPLEDIGALREVRLVLRSGVKL